MFDSVSDVVKKVKKKKIKSANEYRKVPSRTILDTGRLDLQSRSPRTGEFGRYSGEKQKCKKKLIVMR